MARGRGRANIYAGQVDRSWMKFARCSLCGFKCCINNYPDHKVRLTRVKGVFVCPWCQARHRFSIELYLVVKRLAEKPCKKDGCGKCNRCEAKELLNNRQQFQSHNIVLETGM